MRLDKFIATYSSHSRIEAKRAIGKKYVRLNNKVITNPAIKVDLEKDTVTLNDQTITALPDLCIALNKPRNYECSHSPSHFESVLTLLKTNATDLSGNFAIPDYAITDLQIAGRLDADTTGLVLITNNGEWNHQITSPKKKCDKTYIVNLEQTITDEQIVELERGVMLKAETSPTLPAKIIRIDTQPNQLAITLCEGKYHQVKRMFAAVGNRVKSLHRQSIGQINLKNLSEGQWRILSKDEIHRFL